MDAKTRDYMKTRVEDYDKKQKQINAINHFVAHVKTGRNIKAIQTSITSVDLVSEGFINRLTKVIADALEREIEILKKEQEEI